MKEVKEILLLISHEHKRYAKTNRMQHYFTMMRPITIIQAVGAFLVGRLVILSHQNQVNQAQHILSIIMAYYNILWIRSARGGYGDERLFRCKCRFATCSETKIDQLPPILLQFVRKGWILFCFVLSAVSIGFAYLADSI